MEFSPGGRPKRLLTVLAEGRPAFATCRFGNVRQRRLRRKRDCPISFAWHGSPAFTKFEHFPNDGRAAGIRKATSRRKCSNRPTAPGARSIPGKPAFLSGRGIPGATSEARGSFSGGGLAAAALSIARFSFEGVDRRASIDAAADVQPARPQASTLPCREQDGAIVAAFTVDLIGARRAMSWRGGSASVLKHTMLASEPALKARPSTLAHPLKPSDNLSTLVARV